MLSAGECVRVRKETSVEANLLLRPSSPFQVYNLTGLLSKQMPAAGGSPPVTASKSQAPADKAGEASMHGGGDAAPAGGGADTAGRKRKRGVAGGASSSSTTSSTSRSRKSGVNAGGGTAGAARSLLGSLAVCVAWSREAAVESRIGRDPVAASGSDQTDARLAQEVEASPAGAGQTSGVRSEGAGAGRTSAGGAAAAADQSRGEECSGEAGRGRDGYSSSLQHDSSSGTVLRRETGHEGEEPVPAPARKSGREGGGGAGVDPGDRAGGSAAATVSCLAAALQSGDVALFHFQEPCDKRHGMGLTASLAGGASVSPTAPAPTSPATATTQANSTAGTGNHTRGSGGSSSGGWEDRAGCVGRGGPTGGSAPLRLLLRFAAHQARRVTAIAWHGTGPGPSSSLLLLTGASDGRQAGREAAGSVVLCIMLMCPWSRISPQPVHQSTSSMKGGYAAKCE